MQTELGYWVGTAAGIFGVLVAYLITKAATLKGHEACQPEEPFPYDETCEGCGCHVQSCFPVTRCPGCGMCLEEIVCQCLECRRVYDRKPREGAKLMGNVSHGYCPDCAPVVIERIKEETRLYKENATVAISEAKRLQVAANKGCEL